MHDFCHIEIATTDIAASRTFLGGLFEWEFMEMDANYTLFKPPEGPGGGLEKVDAPAAAGGIHFYVHVASIEDACGKAPGLGGSVVKEKTEIGGGHGFYAILGDPGGTEIGIWEASQ